MSDESMDRDGEQEEARAQLAGAHRGAKRSSSSATTLAAHARLERAVREVRACAEALHRLVLPAPPEEFN